MPSHSAQFIETFIRELDAVGISQRIRRLEITPQPNAAVFKFQTNQPTVPVIEIFRIARTAGGVLVFPPSNLVTVKFDFISAAVGNFYTDHESLINGLNQDAEFAYRITAGNGPRPPAIAVGSFKTGKRSARFVVREIQVFNDGDPGVFGGSGEMAFAFGFYNEDDDLAGSRYFHDSLWSGELSRLPFGTTPAFQTSAAPDWMSVYVRGQEDDHFFTPFHEWMSAPVKLPTDTTHYETDDIVVADAFQNLSLPTKWGAHRVGFSLDSGPWGIHFIVTGWVDVEATAPVVMPVIPKSALHLSGPIAGRPQRWAALNAVGQRTVVEHPNGHRSVFGLGPNGVLARRFPGKKYQRQQNWQMVEADGVEAAALAATEAGIQIVTVSAGVIRHRCEPIRAQESPAKWREIGCEFQPHLTAIALSEGAIAVIALGRDGTLRGMRVEGDAAPDQWTDLGGGLAGRVVALPRKRGVEIFGLTPEGVIQTATWQPDSQAGLRWRPLKGEPSAFIHVGDEDGRTHVIAVAHDRRVRLLSREKGQWLTRWVSLGTLDDVKIGGQG